MSLTLLFDLDGTLTDSAPGIVQCIAHALEVHDLEVASEARLRACVGPPLHDSFRELAGGDRHVDTLVDAYRARYVEKGMFENEVYDGVAPLLDALGARGVALHVVTAKPGPFAETVLEHFGLRRHFGNVHGPALEGAHVTKAELIAAARASIDFDPARTVMIGDRGVDMEAARSHEIGAWGVRWGYGSDDELRGAGAQVLFDRPADLLARVTSMLG